MTVRAVFLDRDGVINRVVFRGGEPTAPRELREFEFEAGVGECIEVLHQAGYSLFVITNQPDVRRRLLDPKVLTAMNDRIMHKLKIEGIVVCPHEDSDECECRKPRPGMIIQLARDHDICLSSSYVIGDSWKDSIAAKGAGCRSIILDRAYNQGVSADFRVKHLREAVESVLVGR